MAKRRPHRLISTVRFLGKHGEFILHVLSIALIGGMLVLTTRALGGWIYMGSPLLWPMLLSGALAGVHGLWWLLYRDDKRSLRLVALVLWPFLLYLLLHLWWLSPTPWWTILEFYFWWQAALILWVVVHQFNSRKAIWALLGIALAVCTYALWLGMQQYFSDPSWLPMGRTLPEQYAGRLSGPFGVPNHMGALLALFVPGILLTALSPRFPVVIRLGLGFLCALMLLGLFLTGSRGAMLATACALLLLPIFHLATWPQRLAVVVKVGMLLAVAAVAGSLLFPQTGERLQKLIDEGGESTRKVMWQGAWAMWMDHPVSGAGWGSFTERWDNYRPAGSRMDPEFVHNDYLNFLADGGILGFLSLFLPLGWVVWRLFAHWREIPFVQFSQDQERRLRNVLGKYFLPPEALTGEDRRVRLHKGQTSSLRKTTEVVGKGYMPLTKILLGAVFLGLVAFGLQLLVEFSLKIPALVLFTSLLLACAMREWSGWRCGQDGGPLLRFVPAILLMLGGGALAIASVPILKAQEAHFRAREDLQQVLKDPSLLLKQPELLNRAKRGFDLALSLNPRHGDAWQGRALVLLQSFRAHPEKHETFARKALDAIAQALDLDSQNPDYWAVKGMALGMLPGPPKETEAAYRRALELAPNKPDNPYYLANFLSLFPKRQEEAGALAQRALELDPHHQGARKLIESMGWLPR